MITPTDPDHAPGGLAALEQRLLEDLDRLCLPAEDWLGRPPGDPVLDVAIIGGGMSGLAAAAALKLLGIRRIRVFDQNPAGRAGPWVTHARMQTLRSPKQLTGPALGLPSLTFRAWYEASFGKAAWASLDRIARTQWQDYLDWYQSALALPVTSLAQVTGIAGEMLANGSPGVAFDVHDLTPVPATGAPTRQAPSRYQARHLVLATGMDGLGGPAIPPMATSIPRTRWQHSSEQIDFAAWRDRRIGIVGGGDSALDAAATALEAGAARVRVFIRQADFSRINYWKAFAHPGHYHGFAQLPPATRQPLLDFLKQQRVPPARGTLRRLLGHANLSLHFDSPVSTLAATASGPITVTTPWHTCQVDHLIFATGYRTEPTLRPELARLAGQIRFWSDREPAHDAVFPLDAFPETAADFSLLERIPGACPVLGRIHLFTGGALMSQGKLTGDIPGISYGAERLARGIAARLYAADFDHQLAALQAYDEREIEGHEYAGLHADPSAGPSAEASGEQPARRPARARPGQTA